MDEENGVTVATSITISHEHESHRSPSVSLPEIRSSDDHHPFWSWRARREKREAKIRSVLEGDVPSGQHPSPGAFAMAGIGQETESQTVLNEEIGVRSDNPTRDSRDNEEAETGVVPENETEFVVPTATLVDDCVVEAQAVHEFSGKPRSTSPAPTDVGQSSFCKSCFERKFLIVIFIFIFVGVIVGILAGVGIFNKESSPIFSEIGSKPPNITVASFQPTEAPTLQPSAAPTFILSLPPTEVSSLEPTFMPSFNPTRNPTLAPSQSPTVNPTQSPTLEFDPAQDAAIFASTDTSFIATLGSDGRTNIGPTELAAIDSVAVAIRPRVDTQDAELFTRETVRLWSEQGYDAIIVYANGLPRAQGYDYTTTWSILEFGFLEKEFELFVSNRTHPMIAENKGDEGFINWAFQGTSWVRWGSIVQFIPEWNFETMGKRFVNRPTSNFPGWFF